MPELLKLETFYAFQSNNFTKRKCETDQAQKINLLLSAIYNDGKKDDWIWRLFFYIFCNMRSSATPLDNSRVLQLFSDVIQSSV